MSDPFAPRSLFFVPGSRPDMIAKVPRWAPDAVVADLEDAVPPEGKKAARVATSEALHELRTVLQSDTLESDALESDAVQSGAVLLVRVNPVYSTEFADDVAVLTVSGADGVVLPKYEHPDDLAALRERLAQVGRPDARVVVGLETARGVADCRSLLAQGVDAAYFGAEDYIADLGGRRTPGSTEVLFARSEVCLAARLAGVTALDQAVVDVRDDERFRADAAAGRDIGYPGKICLHPRQVELAHEVFTPAESEVAHARQVLAAAEDGVGVVDGEMVDAVHVRMAHAVLARAGAQE